MVDLRMTTATYLIVCAYVIFTNVRIALLGKRLKVLEEEKWWRDHKRKGG
jgi:hypothetical protein